MCIRDSYYIVSLLGVLFVVGSFLFATNETHFRKGEIAGHQQITPQSITQAVSYTHLDVYKRQLQMSRRVRLRRRQPQGGQRSNNSKMQEISQTQRAVTQMRQLQVQEPV